MAKLSPGRPRLRPGTPQLFPPPSDGFPGQKGLGFNNSSPYFPPKQKARCPMRRVLKPHQRQSHQTRQTSCHYTARATKERRQVPRNSSPGCTSPGALGRGFLVAGDWGPALRVPNLRAPEAWGGHSALLRWNLGLLPPATARSGNPGTVAYLPAQPPPSSGERGCRLATLLSALRSARDPGNPLRASPATPRRTAPSLAAAVFLSVFLLSAQSWAQRQSRAAQLRGG